MSKQAGTVLWLLAHQDDEVLALHQILMNSANMNVVVYLTDGVKHNASFTSTDREQEALRSWKRLQADAQVYFLGVKHGIRDGQLGGLLSKPLLIEIAELVLAFNPDKIITLALEGGHQDHDTTNLIAGCIGKTYEIPVHTYPAYRANPVFKKLYFVMKPLNRTSPELAVSPKSRIKLAIEAINLMKIYSTQKITWLGLGPSVVIKYCFRKLYLLDNYIAVKNKPTHRLYVNRKRSSELPYAELENQVLTWLNA